MRSLLLLVVAMGLTACKGDRVKCEQAARNFATLTFWKKTDAELALLPVAEQKLAREKKLSTFTNELEKDVDFYTQQCVSANNTEQIDCMIAAKTAEQVAKCADVATNADK